MPERLKNGFSYANGNFFRNRLALAPMAGITDAAFSKIVWDYGCGVIYSAMISGPALVYKNKTTLDMLKSCITDEPVIVQIYGSQPDLMAEAARICEDYGVRMLDINMGCSVPKIFRNGCGAALMLNHDKCRDMLRQVRKAARIPLSIKIRSGDNSQRIEAPAIAKIAEAEGVDMIAVHPRTRAQMFRGKSDWGVIRDVKSAVKIPVVGNGDVTDAASALRMIEETGCDMVMIGRGCMGRPWLFSEILTGETPAMEEKYKVIMRHLDGILEESGSPSGVVNFRKHLLWYAEGFQGAAILRRSLAKVTTREEITRLLYPHYHQNMGEGEETF